MMWRIIAIFGALNCGWLIWNERQLSVEDDYVLASNNKVVQWIRGRLG